MIFHVISSFPENGMSDEWYQYKEILDMQRKRLVKAKRHRSENVSERDKLLFLDILGPKFEFIENRRIGGTSKVSSLLLTDESNRDLENFCSSLLS